jgi:hypothetical protein
MLSTRAAPPVVVVTWKRSSRQPPDHAVIADEAVIAEQQAVAAAAGRELRPGVGVHAVHELDRVRPRDVDLAERRGVEDAEAGAGGGAFAHHRGSMVSPGFGKYQARRH